MCYAYSKGHNINIVREYRMNNATINKEFGIGVDIESIGRFRKLDIIDDRLFLSKIFTKKELDYCFSKKFPARHLSARYAAKEAVIKALNSIDRINLNYNSVEISHDSNKAPKARISNGNYKNLHVYVSLSHCKDKSIAFAAVVEGRRYEND